MHVKLLVTTGLVAGFMLGSWTPLGDIVPLETLRDLMPKQQASKVDTHITSLGRFRTLIATAKKEPAGNILQNREIVLVAGFFDPEAAWAMKFADLGKTGGVAMASWPGQKGSRQAGSRQAGTNTRTSHPGATMAGPDQEAWYSQTSDMELAHLRTTIAGIEAENIDIEKNLVALDTAHPDHFMARCIFESNKALIGFYSFLTIMGERGATREDTERLANILQEQRHQTASHGKTGRARAAAYTRVLESLAATTAQDQRIKSKSLEYYDSFVLSFDLEDTLAAHLDTYPALIEEAIRTGEPPRGVSRWVADFQELGRSRMELQAYRQQIAQELAGPGV